MKQRTASLLLALAPLFTSSATAQTCNSAIQEVTPSNDFTFSADTVTDNRTGLTWRRCLEGQTFSDNATPTDYSDDSCSPGVLYFSWQGALQRADGQVGWRLPSSKELVSIVERSCDSPAANLQLFPGMGNLRLWSSSPSQANVDMVWVTDFTTGTTLTGARLNNLPLRLVTGP